MENIPVNPPENENKDDEVKLNFERDTRQERKDKLNKRLDLGIDKRPLYEHKMRMAQNVQKGMKKKKNINLLKKIDISANKNKSNNQIVYLRLLKERNKNKEIRDDPGKLIDSLDLNITNDMKKFYLELLDITKNPSRRVSLPSRLFKDDIIIYVLQSDQHYTRLSNDYLFMNYISYKYLSSNDSILGTHLSFVNIKSIKINSNDFFINKDIFTSYYCEDFDRDVYANEYAALDQSGRKDFMSVVTGEIQPTIMKINNIEYCVYETEPCLVIYMKDLVKDNSPEKIKELLEKGHAFRLEKGIFEKGTKKFTILNNQYYFSSVLVPTNFCSSNAILPRKTKFDCLLRFSFNLDQYFNTIVDKRKVIMIRNLLSWENYKTIIEFFCWLYFMYKVKYYPSGMRYEIEYMDTFKELEDMYNKCSWYIDQWKIHYDNFKKIVFSFLDCFVNRIQLDKLEKVSVACDTFLHDDDRLTNLNYFFDEMVSILAIFGEGSEIMSNFLSKTRTNVISAISFTSKKIYTMDNSSLQISIYSTGNLLYNILLGGTNPMINDIRSEALFLGSMESNIYVEKDLENQIKFMIDEERAKYIQKKQEYKENVINNAKIKEIALDMVRNSLIRSNIPENDIPNLISIVSSNWKKENRYVSALADSVDTYLNVRKYNENDLKKMPLDEENMDLLGLVDNLILVYDKIQQDKKEKLDKIVKMVNEGQKEINVDEVKFMPLAAINQKVNEMPYEEKEKQLEKLVQNKKIKREGKRVRGEKKVDKEKKEKAKKGGRAKQTDTGEFRARASEKFRAMTKKTKPKNLRSAPPIKLDELFKEAKNVIGPEVKPKRKLKYDDKMNLSDLVQQMYDNGYIDRAKSLKLESVTGSGYEIPPYAITEDDFNNMMSDKLHIQTDDDTFYLPRDLILVKLIKKSPSVYTNKEVNGYIVPAYAFSSFMSNLAVEPENPEETEKIYNMPSNESDFITSLSNELKEILEGQDVMGLYDTNTKKLYPIDRVSPLKIYDSLNDLREAFFRND